MISNFYRFSGGESRTDIISSNPNFSLVRTDCYLYLSSSYNHHQYYTTKRIVQALKLAIAKQKVDLRKYLGGESLKLVCSKKGVNLQLTESLNKIEREELVNQLLIAVDNTDFSSVMLTVPNFLIELINEASVEREKKNNILLPEVVDSRTYGGGIGLVGEWLRLLETCVISYKRQDIDKKDLAKFFDQLFIGDRRDNVRIFAPLNRVVSEYPQPAFFKGTHKYVIIESLEKILEQGIYNQKNPFFGDKQKCIRKTISQYETVKNSLKVR